MVNEKRLIDAYAFIEDIKTEIMNLYLDGMKGTPRPRSELYDIIDRIGEQPTVDAVEVVHGYNTGRARWFECSVCGYGFDDIFLLDESDDMMEPKYCGHCGAKMDGERKDNERKAG